MDNIMRDSDGKKYPVEITIEDDYEDILDSSRCKTSHLVFSAADKKALEAELIEFADKSGIEISDDEEWELRVIGSFDVDTDFDDDEKTFWVGGFYPDFMDYSYSVFEFLKILAKYAKEGSEIILDKTDFGRVLITFKDGEMLFWGQKERYT